MSNLMECSKDKLYFLVKTLRRNNRKATEIYMKSFKTPGQKIISAFDRYRDFLKNMKTETATVSNEMKVKEELSVI